VAPPVAEMAIEEMGSAGAIPTVMIVDDQTLFRRGLVKLLESDPRIRIVGDANAAQATEKIAKSSPDVVLLDMSAFAGDAIDTALRILRENPKTRVVMLTASEDSSYLAQAIRAGASGYLLKDSQPEAIVSAVCAVLSGGLVITQSLAHQFLDMVPRVSQWTRYDGMTRRELEILQLVGQGLTNKQVSNLLRISNKTVRNHVSNLYAKLSIRDRSQAVLYAVRKGLVKP
jgi:DNA-binding NarL/FixJ family response regulator